MVNPPHPTWPLITAPFAAPESTEVFGLFQVKGEAMSNARMQQMLTLVIFTAALLWAAYCVSTGWWGGALFVLLLLLPQAPALALETLWAAMVARREGTRRPLGSPQATAEPYPDFIVWCRSWLREVVASVQTFAWRQPWAHQRWPDHVPNTAQGHRGVLLVHGFVCNRGFWNPWMARLREADVPHVAVSLGPPFADIAIQAQGLQAAWQRLYDATGLAPLLVGHSMGGLVIRTWLAQQSEETALAHEVITIGSPHHGTALAMMARSVAATQMQVLSAFLQDLSARENTQRRARFTCYWSVCDNIVFPAHTATLPGARSVAVFGQPHVALAHHPSIIEDVLRRACSEARPVA
jgi:pimeloyl-ACP methyl ester carboxylesterase